MNCGAMLNAYPDSMGGTLSDITKLLRTEEFRDAFRSFYILPSVFNSDLDRGFSVISYDLNRMLASAEALEELRRAGIDLKLDFILNHLSVLSAQFQDIVKYGDQSEYRDFFIDWNQFWAGRGSMMPEGYIQPDEAYIKPMFFRKPGLPILMVRFPDGRDVPYWNTFYQQVRIDPVDAQDLMCVCDIQYGEAASLAQRLNEQMASGQDSEKLDFGIFDPYRAACMQLLGSRRKYLGQMDLNLKSEKVWAYYEEVLDKLAGYGAGIVRLDAFAYAPKSPGMRNFMNEPDTWDTLERIREIAQKRGLTLLPEIHDSYSAGTYEKIAQKGYMTYDFFLPGLIIDAIENHDGTMLYRWAQELQEKGIRTVNMLGCHDGIPMLDLRGMLEEERIDRLIALIVERGGMIKNLHGAKNVYYQVNCTYYSALDENDKKMLLARAIQLFMPGKPQIWYLDLFAGANDLEAVRRGGEAAHKEINRTNLSIQAIRKAMKRSVVKGQIELLRMRNTCKAFDFVATISVTQPQCDEIELRWEADGKMALLHANLTTFDFTAEADGETGRICLTSEMLMEDI